MNASKYDWFYEKSNDYIQLQFEDCPMSLNITRNDFALNPTVLRAVLNRHAIDMKEPCLNYLHN